MVQLPYHTFHISCNYFMTDYSKFQWEPPLPVSAELSRTGIKNILTRLQIRRLTRVYK